MISPEGLDVHDKGPVELKTKQTTMDDMCSILNAIRYDGLKVHVVENKTNCQLVGGGGIANWKVFGEGGTGSNTAHTGQDTIRLSLVETQS